jgi:hypothetical protein
MPEYRWTRNNNLKLGRNIVLGLVTGTRGIYKAYSQVRGFDWHSGWFRADNLIEARQVAQRGFCQALMEKAKEYSNLSKDLGGFPKEIEKAPPVVVEPAGRFELME